MSFFTIMDFIDDRSSESLMKHFNEHCNWCWGHGFGNCIACKRAFNKVYIPIRKKELRIKNGFEKEDDK